MTTQSSRSSLEAQGFELVATYPYRDEEGKVVYEVLRWEKEEAGERIKEFRQRRRLKDGRWLLSMSGVQRIPYRLNELVRAEPGSTIWVVEGEKNVHSLLERGRLATCNSEGANKYWDASWRKWFDRFGKAIIVADKNAVGRKHAIRVHQCLSPLMDCRIFEAVVGEDVTDHLEAGLKLKQLRDVTDAVLALRVAVASSNGSSGNGSSSSLVSPEVVALAEWALNYMFQDPPEGQIHKGRQTTAYVFAQQLRDVDSSVAEGAMERWWQLCPQTNSEGELEPYPLDAAMATLRSALDNPPPEDWTPGVFANGLGEDVELEKAVQRERVRRQARRIVDQEEWEQKFDPPPFVGFLDEELKVADEDLQWTLDRLHIAGGNTTIVAQAKAGKTVLQVNLAKALADGTKFLGEFPASCDGNIAVWNYELSRDVFREWCRDLGFSSSGAKRVVPLNLRGYKVPLWTERGEEWAIEWLKQYEISAWLIDPFGRAYRGAGESNSNDDTDAFLGSLDFIKQQAGVKDLFISVHMGHTEFEEGLEHARGASALEDWPDHRWYLSRDGAQRFFRVGVGRADYSTSALALEYNAGTRELLLSQISKDDSRISRHALYAVEALKEEDNQMTTTLKSSMKGNGTYKSSGIKFAVQMGWIQTRKVGNGTCCSLGIPPKTTIRINDSQK